MTGHNKCDVSGFTYMPVGWPITVRGKRDILRRRLKSLPIQSIYYGLSDKADHFAKVMLVHARLACCAGRGVWALNPSHAGDTWTFP